MLPRCPACDLVYDGQHARCLQCGRDLALPPTEAERREGTPDSKDPLGSLLRDLAGLVAMSLVVAIVVYGLFAGELGQRGHDVSAVETVVAREEGAPAEVPTGPIVLGGRIEVPSVGLVLEVPDGWYAFDATHPELDARMQTFDETTPLLAMLFADVFVDSGPDSMALLAVAPLDGPNQNCLVMVSPATGEDIDLAAAREILEGIPGFTYEPPSYVDLPAGRAVRVDGVSDGLTKAQWWLVGAGRHYDLMCTGGEEPGVEWTSIAESIEFLRG